MMRVLLLIVSVLVMVAGAMLAYYGGTLEKTQPGRSALLLLLSVVIVALGNYLFQVL